MLTILDLGKLASQRTPVEKTKKLSKENKISVFRDVENIPDDVAVFYDEKELEVARFQVLDNGTFIRLMDTD